MPMFLGDNFRATDENGQPKVRIATVFPATSVIVTVHNMHAPQRLAYVDWLNGERAKAGKPPLSETEQLSAMEQSVDLLVDDQGILIRPDASRMDLAFAADELLQEVEPKRRIKYLYLTDRRVREALKRRGECWRMYITPTSPDEMRRMVQTSRASLEGRAIYYYGPANGTRILTYDSFRRLGQLDDAELRQHIAEIAKYGERRNRSGYREVELFMVDGTISISDFAAVASAPDAELRDQYARLCERFCCAVPGEFRTDDVDDPTWRNRLFARLVAQRDDVLVDDRSMGLDEEFTMRVEWQPGARFEEGELILDPALEEPYGARQEKQVSPVVRGLILNLVQEYGDLEYINLGSVLPSPTRNPRRGGRREVYVAQIKQRHSTREILQVIRMQKWGIRERLDEGATLESAMYEAEEYIEYVLDRRVACKQLGMNVPDYQTVRKVRERYDGINRKYRGCTIWSPYFQRDYIAGLATDKVQPRKLGNRSYAMAFARLLGEAAATNIVLGRAELTGEIVFDVGDEIVVEDAAGMPEEIVVADHVGTFVDWRGTLESRCPEYAKPISRRLALVPDRGAFIDAYLSGFVERFTRLQDEYSRYRRAFDTLFKHRPWDPAGSLACRWSCVLTRLREANPRRLADCIRSAVG